MTTEALKRANEIQNEIWSITNELKIMSSDEAFISKIVISEYVMGDPVKVEIKAFKECSHFMPIQFIFETIKSALKNRVTELTAELETL